MPRRIWTACHDCRGDRQWKAWRRAHFHGRYGSTVATVRCVRCATCQAGGVIAGFVPPL
jgi:hypothetical protein